MFNNKKLLMLQKKNSEFLDRGWTVLSNRVKNIEIKSRDCDTGFIQKWSSIWADKNNCSDKVD